MGGKKVEPPHVAVLVTNLLKVLGISRCEFYGGAEMSKIIVDFSGKRGLEG